MSKSAHKKKSDWTGALPDACDVCHTPFGSEDSFVDGKTLWGPWAFMCKTCHKKVGCGLGTGYGQEYS